ncbi:TPA: LPXTG cell wall anchor domain-containing protein [Streptococcus suis]|nr:LPXTG cell wall anchor domain-containing protein [Streptococcus suis]
MKKNGIVKLVCGSALVASMGGMTIFGNQMVYANEVQPVSALNEEVVDESTLETRKVEVQPIQELQEAIDTAKTTEGLTVQVLETVDEGIVTPTDESALVSEIETKQVEQANSINSVIEAQQSEIANVNDHNAQEKARYEAEKAEYEKALADSQNNTISSAEGLIVYGQYDETKKGSSQYYSGITVLNTSDQYTEDNFIDGHLGWTDNTTVTNVQNATLGGPNEDEKKITTGPLYVVGDLKKGSMFTITNIGKTQAGTNINAMFEVVKDISDEANERLRIYESVVGDKSISMVFLDLNYLPLKLTYVDDAGKELKLVQLLVSADIDGKQAVEVEFSDLNLAVLNPSGSDVGKIEGTKIFANISGVPYSEFESTPAGTMAHIGVGSSMLYTFYYNGAAYEAQTDPSALTRKLVSGSDFAAGWWGGVQFQIFGNSSTSIKFLSKPVEPDYKSVTPKVVTYNLSTYQVLETGSRIIRYYDTEGNEIRDFYQDTPENTVVGTPFNTTEEGERPEIIIFNGKKYRRLAIVDGKEEGIIRKGQGLTKYYYELIEDPTVPNKPVEDTRVPEPPKPVTKAETPVVEEIKKSEATLPNTGTENSYALSVMGVLALFGSLLGFRKKKETE